MFRRKKKGMSMKGLLESVYIIASMGEPEDQWDKSALYQMLDSVIPQNVNSIPAFISQCYSEIEDASLAVDEYKWKLILECLKELERKRFR